MTTAEITRERETHPNYPFSDFMRFCPEHTRDSDVVEVCKCNNCYATRRESTTLAGLIVTGRIDPFQKHKPLFTLEPFFMNDLKQLMDAAG